MDPKIEKIYCKATKQQVSMDNSSGNQVCKSSEYFRCKKEIKCKCMVGKNGLFDPYSS